jgi:hypothetical protein
MTWEAQHTAIFSSPAPKMQTVEVNTLESLKSKMLAFERIANQAGVPVRASRDGHFSFLLRLSDKLLQRVLEDFSSFYDIYAETLAHGHSVRDDRALIWQMFVHKKWVPTSDLFSYLEEGDLIEVYRPDFIQVFRNLRFFEVCSYSLEELFTTDWPSLFERSADDVSVLVKIAQDQCSGAIRETVVPSVGVHSIREISSIAQNTFSALHKVLSPIFNSDGEAVGFVGITSAEVLASTGPRPALLE